jgi:hypothetical protein
VTLRVITGQGTDPRKVVRRVMTADRLARDYLVRGRRYSFVSLRVVAGFASASPGHAGDRGATLGTPRP